MNSFVAARLPATLGQRVGLVAGLWALGGLLLAAGGLLWQVFQTGRPPTIQIAFLLPALVFSGASFGLRAARWHLFLRAAGVRPPILTSLRTQFIGFALTLTPGKVGEVYKCYLMERATGAPTARTAPIVLFEKLMDGAAFSGLAIIAAAALPGLADGVSSAARSLIALAAFAAVLGLGLRSWRSSATQTYLFGAIRRAPRGPRIAAILETALQGGADVLRPRLLIVNTTLSFIARSCDGIAMMWAAWAAGFSLPPLGGVFVLNSSGALGGFSMLPGGIGVVEAGMSLLLVSLGASTGTALVTTLLTRILSFWLWVSIGLGLLMRSTLEPNVATGTKRPLSGVWGSAPTSTEEAG